MLIRIRLVIATVGMVLAAGVVANAEERADVCARTSAETVRTNERVEPGVRTWVDSGVRTSVETGVRTSVETVRVNETVDPRVRTWVEPVRVVWTSTNKGAYGVRSSVKNAEALLGRKHGQLPEGISPCVMVNNGDPASVLLDFGRELHGGVQIGNGGVQEMRVRVRFGESVGEAMGDVGTKGATNDHAIRDDVHTLPRIGAVEIGNTGFRFVRIDLVSAGQISLEYVRAVSLMRPMERIGAFKSSDARLNAVWETAVRTVHLCCQEYLWDGIKRDRLVWMGDTHPETRAILSVFGAAAVLPESFAFMEAVTPTDKWMNGIPNYTLWYIRNVHDWYMFTGDAEWVRARGEYLKTTIRNVLKHADTAGVSKFRWFVDWPTEHNRPAVVSGTLGLYAIALDCAATLAGDVLGDAALAGECRTCAAKMRAKKCEPHGAKSAAALLALGGLRTPREMFDMCIGQNGLEGVSTFYGYYMLEAMSAADENQHALDTVRDYWGAMLDMGATSFWEDFKVSWTNDATRLDEMPVPGKKDIHGDFGEFCYPGYRHSLCHGWSAGPAAWCINHVLGIEALDVGCKTVRVKPFLGDLKWAEGAIATPRGPVRVRVERRSDGTLDTKIDAPDGVRIVCE